MLATEGVIWDRILTLRFMRVPVGLKNHGHDDVKNNKPEGDYLKSQRNWKVDHEQCKKGRATIVRIKLPEKA